MHSEHEAHEWGRHHRKSRGIVSDETVAQARDNIIDPDPHVQAYWRGWLEQHHADQWITLDTEKGTPFQVRLISTSKMVAYEAFGIRVELLADRATVIDELGGEFVAPTASEALALAQPKAKPMHELSSSSRDFTSVMALETFAKRYPGWLDMAQYILKACP